MICPTFLNAANPSRSRRQRVTRIALAALTVAAALIAGANPASAATYRYAVKATVAVGVNPLGVAVDSSGGRAYVIDGGDDAVSVIDTVSNAVVATIPFAGAFGGVAVAVAPVTHKVYVLDPHGLVGVIDSVTESVLGTVAVGPMPGGLGVDATSGTVYVSDQMSNEIYVVDGATDTVTATVPVGAFPGAVAVDPGANRVYVANADSLSVIDTGSNTVIATVPVGSDPRAIAVDTTTNIIYVTTGMCLIQAVDGVTYAVTTIANVCDGQGIAVDSTTGTIYVPLAGAGSDSLLVLDGATRQVTARLGVGGLPSGVAVDVSTHTAYVAVSADNAVAVVTQTKVAPARAAAPVDRIAGPDRYATAVEVSKASFADGAATSVVLATGENFPDALVGTPFATAKNAPLLLTAHNALPRTTKIELARVLPIGSPVYLLGGPNAVAPSVEQQVTALGYKVTRIGGHDRYGTAAAVAETLGGPSTVMLVSGLGFPDALPAGPAATHVNAALLLTAGATMPPATHAYLAAHVGTVYAIGGPAAAAAPTTAVDIVGADRYGTAAAVAARFFASPWHAGVATGMNFPDALTGGSYLAKNGWPLLLTDPDALPSTSSAALVAVKSSLMAVHVFGGVTAVRDDTMAAVGHALNG